MSSNLYYQPKTAGQKLLSKELRTILRDGKYFGGLPATANDYSLDYFQALSDAGIEDAEKVVKAIKKYGEIELREEF